MPRFRIQDTDFEAPLAVDASGKLTIKSSPRPYSIEFLRGAPVAASIDALVAAEAHPLILIDKKVLELHFSHAPAMARTPTIAIVGTEEVKNIEGALDVVAMMEREKMTKSSMLFVIGGGIVQDVGAFAGAMYKRGVPWTYVPTTLLGQGDSCMGGKAALNHQGTKNLLGLFSAPRRVIIHTGFLSTLAQEEILSGLGEVFRLCVTGGPEFLERFEALLGPALAADAEALNAMIECSLSAKRAVVEYDEFELDLRRSMNLGHSIGHAFEAITHYAIPHGIGVAVGILVEGAISKQRGLLSEKEYQHLLRVGRPLVPPRVREVLRGIVLDDIVEVLRRDKKTEGKVLKLVVVERIGQIRFIDLPLEAQTVTLLKNALAQVLDAL